MLLFKSNLFIEKPVRVRNGGFKVFCPKCGKQLDDNALFCSECGTKVDTTVPLENDAPPAPVAPASAVQSSEHVDSGAPQPDSTQQRTRRNLLIAIAALLVVCLVLVGVYLTQSPGTNTNGNQTSQASQTTSGQATSGQTAQVASQSNQSAVDQTATQTAAAQQEAASHGIFDYSYLLANPSNIPAVMEANGFTSGNKVYNTQGGTRIDQPDFELSGSCSSLPSSTSKAFVFFFGNGYGSDSLLSKSDLENGAQVNIIYYSIEGTGTVSITTSSLRSRLHLSDFDSYKVKSNVSETISESGGASLAGKDILWAYDCYSYSKTQVWRLSFCIGNTATFRSGAVSQEKSSPSPASLATIAGITAG